MTLSTRKWTRSEYEKMAQVGLLAEDERVELIHGEIVDMSPIDPLHASGVDRANMLLTSNYGATHVVRVQNPVDVGDASQPQPDVVLISAALARDLTRQRRHPSSVELILEVANTSLAYDRLQKGSLYASAGFSPYWIVNLPDDVLEVYTDPRPDSAAPHGWRYSCLRTLGRGRTVDFAGRTLSVDDLLLPVD
ncbi:MAG: Uma2 family endonuclease [Candidatus Eremiobacterota bacterium]